MTRYRPLAWGLLVAGLGLALSAAVHAEPSATTKPSGRGAATRPAMSAGATTRPARTGASAGATTRPARMGAPATQPAKRAG